MIAARLTFWLQSLLGVAPEPAPAKPIHWPRSDPCACANTCPQPRAIQYGRIVCWGADDRWATLPIDNVPPDALWLKRRLRANDTAKVLVRRPDGVSVGYLVPANNSQKDVRSLRIRWTAHNLFTA